MRTARFPFWTKNKKMLINQKYIQINVEAADCFQAIEAAASPLLRDNRIDEGYITAACEREKIFPTGLPTPVGVAIPHAEPDNVLEEAVSLITLKNPVVFHGMGAPEECIDVSIVFLLAIKDGEKQIETLQKIVLMIQDEIVLQKIAGAKNPEWIYNLVKDIDGLD